MPRKPARAERARPGGSGRAEGAGPRESGRPPRAKSEGSEPSEERGEHWKKSRVDKLVMEKGLAETREKARRLVLAGEVLVDEAPVDKPGVMVRADAKLRLRRPSKSFVGRGGEKLQGALDAFGLDASGLSVLDVGASTGGFTDCLLQRGARSVTALDVGKGQLDWKLYSDPRVRVIEGVNARYVAPKDFPEPFDLATLDLSFISLRKVLPAIVPLVKPEGRLLMLVKPQFELSPADIERGGLVRDETKHAEAVASVRAAAEALSLRIEGVVPSPIRGAAGNQEYFLLARRDAARAERARPGGSARAEGAKARESGRPPRARSEGSEPSEERGEH